MEGRATGGRAWLAHDACLERAPPTQATHLTASAGPPGGAAAMSAAPPCRRQQQCRPACLGPAPAAGGHPDQSAQPPRPCLPAVAGGRRMGGGAPLIQDVRACGAAKMRITCWAPGRSGSPPARLSHELRQHAAGWRGQAGELGGRSRGARSGAPRRRPARAGAHVLSGQLKGYASRLASAAAQACGRVRTFRCP
jgi:hypothetical protein